MKLSTQQIGKCGELLVQYQLLLYGVESAPMTTDSGIDLVAYSNMSGRAITIQVKTNLKPKPGGGKGKPSIDWWVPENSFADVFAFVELENQNIWIVEKKDIPVLAQQHSSKKYHLYMVYDPSAKERKDGKIKKVYEFEKYRLGNVIHKMFI